MPRLSPKAQEFLELLTETAREIATQRRWGRATQITLFCPQSAVALALDVDPSTIRRWFYRYPALRERVACRPHYTSISAGAGKRTVIDGMLWTIRLRDGRGELRVPIEDLRHSGYRNLERDIEQGRTLHGSQKATGLSSWGEKVKYVLGWAFGLHDKPINPLGSHDACSLDEAFDGSVQDVAFAICHHLRDWASVRFWLSQVERWSRQGRRYTLKLQIERVLADQAEGFARRPAALLVSRLRPTPAGA